MKKITKFEVTKEEYMDLVGDLNRLMDENKALKNEVQAYRVSQLIVSNLVKDCNGYIKKKAKNDILYALSDKFIKCAMSTFAIMIEDQPVQQDSSEQLHSVVDEGSAE